MKLTAEQIEFFNDVAEPIISHPGYQELKKYAQHADTDRFQHCYNVAFSSYCWALSHNKKIDYEALIRGALLHDFFLGDIKNRDTRPKHHQRTHPKLALATAKKYFSINEIEEDIITKHMYPLTFGFPHYTETHIVINVDNFCSIKEVINRIKAIAGLASE